MAIQLATRGASGSAVVVITGIDRTVISYQYNLFGYSTIYNDSRPICKTLNIILTEGIIIS